MPIRRTISKYLQGVIFVGDILVLNGLFFLLYFTEHFIIDIYENSWWLFLLVLNGSWLTIIFYTNPFVVDKVYNPLKIVSDISYTIFQHFLVTSTAIYLLDFSLVHKWGPALVYIALLVFMIVWRLVFYFLLNKYRAKGYNLKEIVIVGYGQIGKQLEDFFVQHPEYGFRVKGIFDDRNQIHPLFIGKIDEFENYTLSASIDEIYCCLPYIKYGEIKKIIDLCEEKMIKVKVLMDYRAFSFKGLELERYDFIPVLNVSSVPLDSRKNQILKRVFDIAFSCFAIIFLFSWMFPIIALLIKLDSKGPVFFLQKRSGRGNLDFKCLKFRTMRGNAESDTKQATKGDPRVTKIGIFLRKTSIDELPQIFNVLEGSMSIVGPRPHPINLNKKYGVIISRYMTRHYVKPGITGLAQISGYRGETREVSEMKNRVKLDRFYIQNWTFWFDIKIILLTVVTLLRGSEKAY